MIVPPLNRFALTAITTIWFCVALGQTAALDETSSQPLKEVNPKRAEFLVFDVPDLPAYGLHYHSWFVLRGPLLWTPTGTLDLAKITWPKWQTNQVPPAIDYRGSQLPTAVIFDGFGQEIERIPLKKAWAPILYKAPEGRQPHHFHIEIETAPARVLMTSRDYPWPAYQTIFKCNVDVIGKDADKAKISSSTESLLGEGPSEKSAPREFLETNGKVKLCLESMRGIVKNAGAEKQWFIDITWPKPQTRREQMFISDVEREFKTGLNKNKHVLITRRSQGGNFIASAGITQIEKLETITLDTESLPNREWHGRAPTREQVQSEVGTFPTADGGRVAVYAFSTDKIESRNINSPIEFDPPINIQFSKAGVKAPAVRETEYREEHTGVMGLLRPWYLSANANYSSLKSGRGENTSSLSMPGIDVAWKAPRYNLEPFLKIESGVLTYNSPLAVQEGHIGARWRWKPAIYPFLGYLNYSLRGTNPGSSRLGSTEGISAGIYSFSRYEDFLLRGWLSGIYTSPFSYDSYFEIAKIVNQKATDRGLFVGFFAGYTVYRADLRNLTNQIETFSENRFKFGISLGLAGPDFITP